MKVLAVGSEIYPLVKTGGLADVLGALPAALAAEGVEIRTLIPGYPAVMQALDAPAVAHEWDELFGGPARLLSGTESGLALFVLDAPHLYARPGNPYTGPDGADWPDNAMRFAALGRAAASVAQGLVPEFRPDILHAHDWQAGLAPAYLRYDGALRPATVMTVHNLAYQGQVPAYLLGLLGLPPHAYAVEGVEYYSSIGFLKAGLYFADAITTVSPTYAAELQTEAGGMGFAGLFQSRADRVSGILNGIDTGVWNPATDPHLPAPYDAARLDARAASKAALQQRLGLAADPGRLLIGVVSRLAWQKGLDLLHEVLPVLTGLGMQLAVLGTGEAPLEAAYNAAARASPAQISCTIGFDEGLAHLIQAGADAILVPSRFEPCGLTQLIAQRFGAIPIVARTGGLADTVIDANEVAVAAGVSTGIQFSPVTADALASALRRASQLWSRPTSWAAMQRNGMALDLSWIEPARRYAALYRRLVVGRFET